MAVVRVKARATGGEWSASPGFAIWRGRMGVKMASAAVDGPGGAGDGGGGGCQRITVCPLCVS